MEAPRSPAPPRRWQRVLLVDDHGLFLEGLVLLMQHRWPGLQLQVAHSLAQALEAVAAGPAFDGVLLDLGLPDCAGLQGLQALRQADERLVAVVLSADERPATVLDALQAGAAGFIGKTANSAQFQAALACILEGGIHLPPSVLAASTPPSAAPPELTPRQWDVLGRVLEGKSNKQIGRELDMSPSTVKTHLAEIFRRLEVRSRTQAVIAMAQAGRSARP